MPSQCVVTTTTTRFNDHIENQTNEICPDKSGLVGCSQQHQVAKFGYPWDIGAKVLRPHALADANLTLVDFYDTHGKESPE